MQWSECRVKSGNNALSASPRGGKFIEQFNHLTEPVGLDKYFAGNCADLSITFKKISGQLAGQY